MCLPGMDGKEEVCKSQLWGPSCSSLSSRTIKGPGGRKRAR